MKKQEKDESLFDLTEEEEEDIQDGSLSKIEDETETESTEIVGSANAPSTLKNAGIVAVIGLIGYFIAQRLKGGSSNQSSGQMETNFKPVDFGF